MVLRHLRLWWIWTTLSNTTYCWKTATWKFLFSSANFVYDLYSILNLKKQQVVHILFSQYGVQKKIIFFPKNKKRKHHMHTRGLLTSAFNCIPTHSQCSFYLLMTSYQMCLRWSCKLLHVSSYKTSCASPEIPHICHFIMDSIIGIPAEGYDEGGAIPHVCMTLVTLGN